MGEIPKYNIYKGLSKPLVFKGLIGKYIYIGAIGILVLLIMGLVLLSTFGFLAGAGVLFGGGGALFYWIFKKQKNGIYDKQKDDGSLYVVTNRINLMPLENREDTFVKAILKK